MKKHIKEIYCGFLLHFCAGYGFFAMIFDIIKIIKKYNLI
jgi:hypothetical protein